MTRRRLSALLLLFVFVFTTGCAGETADEPSRRPPSAPAEETHAPTPPPAAEVTPTAAPTPAPTPSPAPSPEPTPEPDPVREQLEGMTLEEKVGQLLVAGIGGTEPGEDGRAAVQDYHAGGVILFSRNVESAPQLTKLTNDLKALAGDGVPLFLCVDEEGGRVSRMPPEVADLPSAYTFGQTGDAAVGYALGQALAAECAAFGINLDFAPSLDIWSNPDNTVIGDRSYGATAEAVEAIGPWVAWGMIDAGVIPTVKHFPGHGDTSVDSHVGLPVVDRSLEELRGRELLPFQAAIGGTEDRTGVPAVMVAHILMTTIDPDYPASLSPKVVTGLLREELGFDGLVCTDDLTMGAIAERYSVGEAAVLAVEAGCDLLLVCHKTENLEAAYTALLRAVTGGRISEARLDESVYRILSLKAEYGITSQPVSEPDVAALNETISAILPELAETPAE